MYQFPNQSIVHHGYQQCSFFGPSVSEPAASTLRHEPESVAPLAPVNSQPVVNNSPDGDARAREGTEARGAKNGARGAVDTSSFSVEQRVVAAVWVHERHHTHTSMGQIKRQFLERFGRAPPARNTLLAWERKLFAAGAVHDAPRPGRPARRYSRRRLATRCWPGSASCLLLARCTTRRAPAAPAAPHGGSCWWGACARRSARRRDSRCARAPPPCACRAPRCARCSPQTCARTQLRKRRASRARHPPRPRRRRPRRLLLTDLRKRYGYSIYCWN